MKKTLFVLGLSLLFVPFLVQAVTAEELRIQIQALLAQIASLQNQSQSQPAPVYTPPTYSGTTPTTTGGTFQYSRCPDLQYNLERGDTDATTAVEVTMLQRFLAQDSTLYPEGQITGVFGPATERAVERFQNRHGIVSYGDYQATGYGRVGPRTRWAIKNSCGEQAQPFEVYPTTGTSPLKVTVAFSGYGSNCTSYAIDWGDGTPGASLQAVSPVSACLTDSFERSVTHTYANAGSFSLSLKTGKGSLSTIPVVGTVPITVSGGVPEYTVTYVPPPQTVSPPVEDFSTCFVSPRSGSAPLTSRARVVLGGTLCDGRFSYQVDWGDGTLSEARSCSSTASHYDTFTHNYSTPGSYTARLLQTHPQAFFNEETCAVSVSSAGTGVSGSYGAVAPPTCAQWYDGCNNCSRSYAGGPAACTLRACTQYTALQCYQYFGTTGTTTTQDSLVVSGRSSGTTAETITFGLVLNGARSCSGGLYVVDFGDGTYDQQPFPADACTAFSRTVSHTYTTNGIYTVRLIKDSATQATLQVQISSIIARSIEKNMAAVFEAVKSIVSHFIQ